MFRTIPLYIIRSFSPFTQQWYMSYRFVDSCDQDQDGTALPSWSCLQAVYKPLCHTPLLCVRWETPDDGQRNCPKHVEIRSKIKFEKISAYSWFFYKDVLWYYLQTAKSQIWQPFWYKLNAGFTRDTHSWRTDTFWMEFLSAGRPSIRNILLFTRRLVTTITTPVVAWLFHIEGHEMRWQIGGYTYCSQQPWRGKYFGRRRFLKNK